MSFKPNSVPMTEADATGVLMTNCAPLVDLETLLQTWPASRMISAGREMGMDFRIDGLVDWWAVVFGISKVVLNFRRSVVPSLNWMSALSASPVSMRSPRLMAVEDRARSGERSPG